MFRLCHRWRFLAPCLVFAAAAMVISGCGISSALRVQDRRVLPLEQVIDDAAQWSVLVIGEIHTDQRHHDLQLEVVRRLDMQGFSVAVGLEMFAAESQPQLDAWTGGELSEPAFRVLYARDWRNVPWGLYDDIFLFARKREIPLLGLNMPHALIQKVARSGFASLTEEERQALPEGITGNVDSGYVDFVKNRFPTHGRSDKDLLRFGEAQMLWNRVMARRVSAYLKLHPQTKVVVLVGAGHGRKRGGIPEELAKEGIAVGTILPEHGRVNAETVTTADADYLMLEKPEWVQIIFGE